MHWTKTSIVLGLATGTLLFGGVAAVATTISAGGSAGPASFGATASTPAGAEVTPPTITPPSVSEPKITPPSVSEPKVTPPSVTAAPPSLDVNEEAATITVPLPQVTEPHVEGPQVTEPSVEGPQVTEPQVQGPQVSVNPTITPIGASAEIHIG